MKKSVIAVSFMITASAVSAQKINESEVPVNVKSAFQKQYPNAKKVKWEKENNDFEAEFELNKTETSAVFDSKGSFKEQEQEIKLSDLPKTVIDYCKKNYADYKMEEASKITDANGKISYEVELEKGKQKLEVFFDSNGNFIKKEDISNKAEDKD
jgi:hypothetical protein